MVLAGLAHLWARTEFQALVPEWIPVDAGFVVIASGIVEIALGLGLIFLPSERREMGAALAVFFILVYPGNIAQYLHGVDAFGLDTDAKRLARLFFQPPLVLLALWVSVGPVQREGATRLLPAPTQPKREEPPRLMAISNYLIAGLLAILAGIALIGFFIEGELAGLFVSLMFAVWSWGFSVRARYETAGMPDWKNKPVRHAVLLMLLAALLLAAFLALQEKRDEEPAGYGIVRLSYQA